MWVLQAIIYRNSCYFPKQIRCRRAVGQAGVNVSCHRFWAFFIAARVSSYQLRSCSRGSCRAAEKKSLVLSARAPPHLATFAECWQQAISFWLSHETWKIAVEASSSSSAAFHSRTLHSTTKLGLQLMSWIWLGRWSAVCFYLWSRGPGRAATPSLSFCVLTAGTESQSVHCGTIRVKFIDFLGLGVQFGWR